MLMLRWTFETTSKLTAWLTIVCQFDSPYQRHLRTYSDTCWDACPVDYSAARPTVYRVVLTNQRPLGLYSWQPIYQRHLLLETDLEPATVTATKYVRLDPATHIMSLNFPGDRLVKFEGRVTLM